ncbi:alpha/beta hydrolase [Oscillatoria sp. FACHB-1407]|uniref:alpha/beta hydrolase n=1 Tax=Oscillatoria sp. FACHB-1407 TaxID=2692847 RepID=UPI001F554E14|nr:alpha/beta hydrolase [Oscillatoria sp. FACHB-1407]
MLTATPALSAERIYISYGLLERSVSVKSLEIYATEGRIEDDLRAYTAYATPESLEQLQTLLDSPAAIDIDVVAISQFLYTSQGEFILEQLGELIQTEAREPGFYAIRAALILAAADEAGGGLTPLNILRHFPGRGIRVDVQRTLQVVQELEELIQETSEAIAAVEQQATIEAATELTPNYSQLPNLEARGSYTWQTQTITLKDRSRDGGQGSDRTYETDLYLPLTAAGTPPPTPTPVIVISHGLGSGRSAYAYLARHLASYGFAVAVPEHPGSNSDQLEALISGRTSQVAQLNEFIDRPLDITFLLDHLEYRSQVDPSLRGRLDLQRVGVVGQSLGGYTSLALAGAEINIPQLQSTCPPPDPFNISLLLQCQALNSTQAIRSLRDERVKAIIPINPIGSSLLGEQEYSDITIPVMMVTGNADTIAPSLTEQIQPFTWLSSSDKYLVLMRGGTHFSTLGEPEADETVVDLPPEVVGRDRPSARAYLNALSVAFFQTYVADQPNYSTYLRSAYAKTISRDSLPLRLVRYLNTSQLARSLQSQS